MPTDTYDPWEEDNSATFLTDFIGTVQDSFWSSAADQAKQAGRDVPDYDGADRAQLYWNVRVDDVTQEDFDKDVPNVTVTLSVGSGWWADETGENVIHEEDDEDAGKLTRFKGSSKLGEFQALLGGRKDEWDYDKIDNEDKPIDYDFSGWKRYQAETKFTNPRNSKGWEGTTWQFRGMGIQMRGQKMRDVRVKPLPVAFLGSSAVDSSGSSSGTVSESTSSTGTVEPEAVAQVLPPDTAPETVEAITAAINTSTSHTEFSKKALKNDEVRGSAVLTKAVMDEASGLWGLK